MGKVEMSLQEYDNLKIEHDLYEEIVNAITTPKINDWDLDWYNNHTGSSLPVYADNIFGNLSQAAQRLLKSLIQIHIDSYLSSRAIEGTFQFDTDNIEFKLGSIETNMENYSSLG